MIVVPKKHNATVGTSDKEALHIFLTIYSFTTSSSPPLGVLPPTRALELSLFPIHQAYRSIENEVKNISAWFLE